MKNVRSFLYVLTFIFSYITSECFLSSCHPLTLVWLLGCRKHLILKSLSFLFLYFLPHISCLVPVWASQLNSEQSSCHDPEWKPYFRGQLNSFLLWSSWMWVHVHQYGFSWKRWRTRSSTWAQKSTVSSSFLLREEIRRNWTNTRASRTVSEGSEGGALRFQWLVSLTNRRKEQRHLINTDVLQCSIFLPTLWEKQKLETTEVKLHQTVKRFIRTSTGTKRNLESRRHLLLFWSKFHRRYYKKCLIFGYYLGHVSENNMFPTSP